MPMTHMHRRMHTHVRPLHPQTHGEARAISVSSSINGGTAVCGRGSLYFREAVFFFFFFLNKGTCWETLFSKNRSERYRLYFLFSPLAPSALEATEGRDPRWPLALVLKPATSWSLKSIISPDFENWTPCPAPPRPAPSHAKVLWRTQKFLTALFEAKLPTVALRRWSV